MKRKVVITIIILLIINLLFAMLAYANYRMANIATDKLQVRVENIEQRIIAEITHIYLTEPEYLFQRLENHPEWEEIESVPYSQCYRHLTGAGTSTADYIMCKAI